ncbi:MAG: hypothetical protein HC802_02095 [Caldilineaceae bacterium]|nr:hypothetical protein [Caldilineaceae bacterium]
MSIQIVSHCLSPPSTTTSKTILDKQTTGLGEAKTFNVAAALEDTHSHNRHDNMQFSRRAVTSALALLSMAVVVVDAATKKQRINLTDEQIGDRNRFWKHALSEQKLVHDGVNHYGNIQGCIQSTMTAEEYNDLGKVTNSKTRKAGLRVYLERPWYSSGEASSSAWCWRTAAWAGSSFRAKNRRSCARP